MNMNDLFALLSGGSILFACAIVACIGIVLIAMAAIFIYLFRRAQQKGEAAKTWPATTGLVLAGRVDVSHTLDANNVSSTRYTPQVSYEFSVNGQHYRGDTVRLGIYVQRGGYAGAQQIVAKYLVGSTVPVYYNPANPNESVLER